MALLDERSMVCLYTHVIDQLFVHFYLQKVTNDSTKRMRDELQWGTTVNKVKLSAKTIDFCLEPRRFAQ